MSTATRPEFGVRAVLPYLCVGDARAAIAYYGEVFGAVPVGQAYLDTDGRVGHAELQFGETVVMLSDEYPEIGVRAPTTLGGTPVALHVDVPDAAHTVRVAEANGATVLREVGEESYGALSGTILDPWGHRWMVSTPRDQPPIEELARRSAEEGFDVLPTAEVLDRPVTDPAGPGSDERGAAPPP